jgi:hypothetical protein
MRAYYANHKHVRLFVLGTPEGWHGGMYDLQKQKWTFDVAVQQNLKDAKGCAEQKAASMLKGRIPELKWY